MFLGRYFPVNKLDEFYLNLGIDFELLDKWDLSMFRASDNYHIKDRWLNFSHSDDSNATNSILMYAKGNHSGFLELFDKFYEHTNSTAPEGNTFWHIPYKDPIDKLLGGYLCSAHWNEHHSKRFASTKTSMYNEIEEVLDTMVDSVLDGSIFRNSPMMDRHISPLSLILRNALIEYDVIRPVKISGLDLDDKTELKEKIYDHFFAKNPNKIKKICDLILPNRSPYSKEQHYYVSKYKINNPDKIKALATGPLKNDYILIEYFAHEIANKSEMFHG